jgi:ABC-type branched-subunit amino acid transport system substrate-binding protein
MMRGAAAAAVVAVLACILAALSFRPGTSRKDAPTNLGDDVTVSHGDDAPLADREQRGKEIYEKGVSSSGRQVSALLEGSGVEVPASVVMCVNCHGVDGRGVAEGGITPPDITWDELTKPYGATTSAGRRRPAYEEALFARAVSMGIDSSGRTLQPAMPRYRLSIDDSDDLISYIKRLGHSPEPGVIADTIRIASILPPLGASETVSRSVGAALAAYVDEVNSGGGVYGRRLDLRLVTAAESPGARSDQAARLLAEEKVFALVACFADGWERELARLSRRSAVPLVGALTPAPLVERPPNRYVFYVEGSTRGEALTLVDHAPRGRAPSRVAIVASPDETVDGIAAEVAARVGAAGGSARRVELHAGIDLDALVRSLSGDGVEMLLVLDNPARILPVLRRADAADWHPRLLIPGSMATRSVFEIPGSFVPNVLLAFSSLEPLSSWANLKAYDRLAAKAGLSRDHLAAQFSALASMAVLVEALKRAGRGVRRESLVDQLERFAQFSTGFSPPVSFNQNRHVGSHGAFIAGLRLESKALERLTGWVEPAE